MFASSSSGCISTVKFGAFANLSLVFSILQGCHSNDSSSGILQFSSGGFAITIQSSGKFAIAPKSKHTFIYYIYYIRKIRLKIYLVDRIIVQNVN
jgi:hypothetical protein